MSEYMTVDQAAEIMAQERLNRDMHINMSPLPWKKENGILYDANGMSVSVSDTGIGLSTGIPTKKAEANGRFLEKAIEFYTNFLIEQQK